MSIAMSVEYKKDLQLGIFELKRDLIAYDGNYTIIKNFQMDFVGELMHLKFKISIILIMKCIQ
jgi:hypothetical protein